MQRAPSVVETHHPWSWRWLRTWSVFAGLFTAVIINYSLRRGRLLIWPFYDDVSYINDALRRLLIWDRGGVAAVLSDYIHRPPHSPGYVLPGMLCMRVFGRHDWAVYIGTGVLVLALLLATDTLMFGATRLHRLTAGLFVLSIPATAVCVLEYRPDNATGLASALAMLLMLGQAHGNAESRWTARRGLLIGLLWTAALLCKPTVAPLTLFLAAVGVLLQFGVARAATGSIRSLLAWRYWIALAAPVLFLALPHYVLAFSGLRRYVNDQMFGDFAATWHVGGGWTAQASYFLTGLGGNLMFGRRHFHLVALLVLVGIGSIVVLSRRQKGERAQWAALLIALGASYAFPAINPTKDQFFATTFNFLLIFTAIMGAAKALGANDLRWQQTLRRTTCVVLVAGVLLFRPPEGIINFGPAASEGIIAARRVEQNVYRTILARQMSNRPRIGYTLPGYADGMAIRYRGLVDGRDLPVHVEQIASNDDAFRRAFGGCDFVVACDSGSRLAIETVPAGPYAERALALLKSDPDMELIETVPALDGRSFYVFQRAGERRNAPHELPR